MKRLRLLTIGLVSLAVSSCANPNWTHPPEGEHVHISQETATGLQEYLQLIGRTRPGAFAVTENGRSYSYYYCSNTMCMNTTGSYAQEAIRDCLKYGPKCYILANNGEVKYEYTTDK